MSCCKHQDCMSNEQLAAAAISAAAWFLGALPTVAETLVIGNEASDLAVMWLAIGPGFMGGLAMQMLPDVMKSSRQVAAELICSVGAAVLVAGWARASIGDVFQLGGICFLSGIGGSALIIAWAKLVQGAGIRILRAIFGSDDESAD